MSDRVVFDVDGFRAVETGYRPTAVSGVRRGLSVECTTVGGMWLLTEQDVERMCAALTAWLGERAKPHGGWR